jgi:AAA+ ATPase superfamily predicted ATPase
MHNLRKLIVRGLESDIYKMLEIFPAVLILGSRQCGKSTLVKMIVQNFDEKVVYLDLQNIADINKLSEPALFFEANKQSIVCLDEIQLVPLLMGTSGKEKKLPLKHSKIAVNGSWDVIAEIPEGRAGTNPGDLSKSDMIEIIYRYF